MRRVLMRIRLALVAFTMAGWSRTAAEPPAFTIAEELLLERAAVAGLVQYPMFAALDDRGRLFVAESSGLDLYAEISAGTRRCRLVRLEDRDGDGRYETRTVFADRLVFPMGIACRDGRVFVADPPDLIALEDRDGDGRADTRNVILSGFGHKDNGSLHGLVFGPDGLLSMTMGMPDGYRLPRGDGTWLEGSSGAWIRCRPDGSRPEVLSRGFVNLVEVAFLPDGDAIGTDNWYQEPAGGHRDALVHLVEGGLYPYTPDSGTPQPVTGPPLPPLARFPAVALSGLARLDGPSVPAPFRGNLVSAQHNSRSVGRHVLIPDGSTYRSRDSLLLAAADPDFHPSDVLVEGDGSLLVVDTGAWYVQHCPTGRIRPAASQGGLWRLRWRTAPRTADPYGLTIDLAAKTPQQLAALLGDPRPFVRARAGRLLAAQGGPAIAALGALLAEGRDESAAMQAVWVLAAIDDPATASLLRRALDPSRPELAAAAARALALRADREAAPALVRCLRTGTPRLRRAAADALARCGGRSALPDLWAGLTGELDPFLRHAIVHALHHLAETGALLAALDRPEPAIQAAALVLLDQPPRPRDALSALQVAARVDSHDPALQAAAIRVLSRHPEWAGESLPVLRSLVRRTATGDVLERLTPWVLALQDRPELQRLLAESASDRSGPPERRAWALGQFRRVRLDRLPGPWVEALGQALRDPDDRVVREAVAATRAYPSPALEVPLAALAEDANRPVALRLEAWRAVLAREPSPPASGLDFLFKTLAAADPGDRLAAAAALAAARLDDQARRRLLEIVRGDPLVTPDLIAGAFATPLAPELADAWISYLEGSLRGGWRPASDRLKAMLAAIPVLPPQRRNAILAALEATLRERQSRLSGLTPLLSGGDPAKGQAVFHSQKAACATCHRVSQLGGLVGPDLTRIGAVRSGPDLLESVVYPSASFAQGYEPHALALDDGRVLQGVIAAQDDARIVLREPGGAEVAVPRSRVEEIRRLDSSIMPEGLARTLTPDELRDLLAFLQGLK